MSKLYTKEEVKRFIPHRDPFLFIDSIEEITEEDGTKIDEDRELKVAKDLNGITVKARFHVREDLAILEGHLPGDPILPGVVQVEMMAQAACFASTLLFEKPLEADIKVALMGVSNAKFRKPVRPGMDLDIRAVCTRGRGNVVNFECAIHHEEELVSESSVMATVSI